MIYVLCLSIKAMLRIGRIVTFRWVMLIRMTLDEYFYSSIVVGNELFLMFKSILCFCMAQNLYFSSLYDILSQPV